MHKSSSDSPDTSRQFVRTREFFGDDGLDRLRSAKVVVIGLGGVGSHAAVALARTGVGSIRIVDFDEVSASSLNRSAVATTQHIGAPKVDVVGDHLEAIFAEVKVDRRMTFFHEDTADALLEGNPDFVIDAIDALTPKVALLRICYERKLPIVTCMGAAGRSDPTRVRVADFSKTENCRLARNVRKRLRRLGITDGIDAVYSLEPALPSLPPDANEPRLGSRGRVRRSLPSIITIPAIFGLTAVSVAVQRIVKA